MLRGSTPTIQFTVYDESGEVDLSQADVMYLSFGQRGEEVFSLDIERLSVSDNVVTAVLTQEETLQLAGNLKTQVQLRWREDTLAYGTDIILVDTDMIIKEGAI